MKHNLSYYRMMEALENAGFDIRSWGHDTWKYPRLKLGNVGHLVLI